MFSSVNSFNVFGSFTSPVKNELSCGSGNFWLEVRKLCFKIAFLSIILVFRLTWQLSWMLIILSLEGNSLGGHGLQF